MRKAPRHAFRFKVEVDGKPTVLTSWAKVFYPTKAVELFLTAEDVRRSIELKGVGNTQTCSMAICAKRSASAFPHPVEGYIDWQYSRAYVVSKVSKATGLPIACFVYAHADDWAKLNDSKDGQRKLLKFLEEHGNQVVRLRPVKRGSHSAKPREMGRRTGTRSSRPAGTGAKLRFAVAQLGGVAA